MKTHWHKLTDVLIAICCITFLSASFAVADDIRVKDSRGTELIFAAPPQRVICIAPSAAEIIFELGAKDAVTGLTHHDATLEGAEEKEVVGGFFQPSVEKIIALKPDLVIVSDVHEPIMAVLNTQGIKVFVYDTPGLEQSFDTITTFGVLFDRQEQARKIIKKNTQDIALIQKKLAKAVPGQRKRVIRLMGRDTIMTPGNDSFQNDLIRMAGGIPPDFGRKGAVVDVTKEEWIKFNPQVIYGCKGDEKAAEKFFSLPGWGQVDAVQNQEIYYFPCELTCRAATYSGYFIQWLSSMIYMDEFAKTQNHVLPAKIQPSRPLQIDLDYIKSAAITPVTIYDFNDKTLMIDFLRPMTIVSTLEGQRDNILSVGNHYSSPPTWGPGHKMGIDFIRDSILQASNRGKETTSFLVTGADMDNLSIQTAEFKQMKVIALVTAGVMGNAVRMSKDIGMYYEPGTINMIIMTNMKLSSRAMTRAIISATEAKTAALEDLDIRSAYTPQINEATGTGTDNIIMVNGEGTLIDNAGGHSKMGELMAQAVYAAVNQAILKQNRITAKRHVFQRLKERQISVVSLISDMTCDCTNQKNIQESDLSEKMEHLLLEKQYSAFIEAAFAISDEYEKGLIKDLTLFDSWCEQIASSIAGKKIHAVQDYISDPKIPRVLKTALNSLITGSLYYLDKTDPKGHNE
ncbi:MAG: adenosylcobinamide amidohydrolase [Proteobacteria bacterium]|nr:adenosylcobinamide amidohydrolase [Pseudomonadota bacterium]MBU1386841.1 adenosylcobinamide amidohydrolase [Pseudomonadota bacterium]MBU1541408.1 adenosylcobinamide amidohydrolase [Pseudomonadota bacterium]MBU2483098.1 adenosylcobinamide amidohydrolase [Pseudomonadota bacterium]